jgi:toxin ParE1/3/4
VSANKWLEWSPRAGRDLLAIREYYADYSQITADRVLTEIRRTALQLETYPSIGRPGQVPGTRELVLPKYPFTLVYRIVGSRVRIGRVLHQHQKYPD